MRISIIVAMDEKRGIGVDDRLPWRLSSDLKRFKRITMGHHLIMGRKTYATIGRPLPGRHTIVLSRNPEFNPEGCFTKTSLDDALKFAEDQGEEEVFICGGAAVYRQSIPIADRIYLTQVHAEVKAEVYFPGFDMGEWDVVLTTSHDADSDNQFPTTFKILDRINLS